MDDTYNAVAIVSAAVIVLLALWTALRMHAERPFSSVGVLLSAAGAVLALVIYELTLDVDLKMEAIIGLVAGGAVAGLFTGRLIPLQPRQSGVLVRASGWHLVPPMLAIAALQVTGGRESFEGVVIALAALYATTAFAVIACAVLLVRHSRVQPAAAPAIEPRTPVVVEGPRCPECGESVRLDWSFCMTCGTRLQPPAPVSQESAPV